MGIDEPVAGVRTVDIKGESDAEQPRTIPHHRQIEHCGRRRVPAPTDEESAHSIVGFAAGNWPRGGGSGRRRRGSPRKRRRGWGKRTCLCPASQLRSTVDSLGSGELFAGLEPVDHVAAGGLVRAGPACPAGGVGREGGVAITLGMTGERAVPPGSTGAHCCRRAKLGCDKVSQIEAGLDTANAIFHAYGIGWCPPPTVRPDRLTFLSGGGPVTPWG